MRIFKLVKHILSLEDGMDGKASMVLIRYVSLPFMPHQNCIIQLGNMIEVSQAVAYVVNTDAPQEEGTYEILTEPVIIPTDEFIDDVIADACREGWACGESDVDYNSIMSMSGCACGVCGEGEEGEEEDDYGISDKTIDLPDITGLDIEGFEG